MIIIDRKKQEKEAQLVQIKNEIESIRKIISIMDYEVKDTSLNGRTEFYNSLKKREIELCNKSLVLKGEKF